LTTGIAGRALSSQRAINRVLQACRAQTSCREAFPSLADDLSAVHEELSAEPLAVPVERSGTAATVSLDGERLLRQLVGALRSRYGVARVPALITALRREDRIRAARLLLGPGGDLLPLYPIASLAVCHDIDSGSVPAERISVTSQLRPPFGALASELEDCRIWHERMTEPPVPMPEQSNIPALIFTGEFDPLTTPEDQSRFRSALPNARWYEMPGEGHAESPAGCKASVLFQFLANPAREPDASCVAAMPRLVFATRLPDSILTLEIAATGQRERVFAGTWEAEFPGQTTIAVTARGADVSGNLAYVLPNTQSGSIRIDGGRIDGNVVTFEVSSPGGGRTITFTATLQGDALLLSREVAVPPRGNPGGGGIFGASAPRSVLARRVR
jgi:hypothetical protein